MRVILSIGAAVAFSGEAIAQQVSQPMAALQQCRTITIAADRLACFDTAVAALDSSVRANELVIVDRESLKRERRRQFGREIKTDPTFTAAQLPEPTELKGKILAVRSASRFLTITIEGGGIWRTTEQGLVAPNVGDSAVVSKGALGSYFISYRGRSLKARRIG